MKADKAAQSKAIEIESTKEVVPTQAPQPLVPVAGPNPELLEKMQDAREALESFDAAKLPPIKMKDGQFIFGDGEEPVDAFEGVIIFTRQCNVYYKKQYKPGQMELPDCYSPDGRTPVNPAPNGANPQAATCKACPHNQFKTSATGDGKACRNTRPLFILVGDEAIMPRIVKIPPTSLKIIEQYVLACVADTGSYMGVKTQFACFKKNDAQTHFNIKLTRGAKLTEQERANVKAIRDVWINIMREGNFAMDSLDEEAHEQSAAPSTREAPPSMATQQAPVGGYKVCDDTPF